MPRAQSGFETPKGKIWDPKHRSPAGFAGRWKHAPTAQSKNTDITPFAHGRPEPMLAWRRCMSASYREEEMRRRLHIRILLSRSALGWAAGALFALPYRTAPGGPAQHSDSHIHASPCWLSTPDRVAEAAMGDRALKTQLRLLEKARTSTAGGWQWLATEAAPAPPSSRASYAHLRAHQLPSGQRRCALAPPSPRARPGRPQASRTAPAACALSRTPRWRRPGRRVAAHGTDWLLPVPAPSPLAPRRGAA
jgi:hypothetical protein